MTRTVAVTGASSGIGRAAALAFARRGDTLVLGSRDAARLASVAAACRAYGASVKVVPLDVAERDSVDAFAAEAGPVDVWVNTAAVMAYGTFEDVPADVFDRVVRTDLLGSANVARAALSVFRTRGEGVLILTGSLLGHITAPYMSGYVTSKWGMRGLARVLRQETRDAPGIHVCVVDPGGVDTPIYRNAANYAGAAGRPPPPVDSAAKVAAAIVRCAARPRASVSVGLANPFIRFGFTALPPVFDALVGPLMRRGGLSPAERVAPTRGNVFAPHEAGGENHPVSLAPVLAVTAAAAATGLFLLGRRLLR